MNSEGDKVNGPEPLPRVRVPALDAILGVEYPVLDHGFVRVIDYMGSDDSIVQAARVSYGSGTRSVQDDVALIRYLLRHSHTTPFEMCEIKLHVKLPIFVARQWIRHRTANVNEYSGRYSVIDKEFYVPAEEAVASQSGSNRQGRGDRLSQEGTANVRANIIAGSEEAYARYEALLAAEPDGSSGVSRELARIGLGVNFYSQWYWKIDLHNLMRFLELRVDPHAQFEIRQYAVCILDIMKLWIPHAHKAFLDYRLNAVTLSAQALELIKLKLAGVNVIYETSGLGRREWDEVMKLLAPEQ